MWKCVECSIEYKRHSKSINPTQQACGACKGKLVQTKPQPKGEAKVSEYQLFVKENCQRIKRENPGMAHGAVMEMLGRLYREQKQGKSGGAGAGELGVGMKAKVDVDAVMNELEVITLDD